jgi:hypothetical protein
LLICFVSHSCGRTCPSHRSIAGFDFLTVITIYSGSSLKGTAQLRRQPLMQAGCGTWHQRHARPPAAQLLCTRSTCHTRAYARKQHTGQPSAEQEVGKQSPLTTGHTKELELAGQQIESRNEPNLEHPQPEHQQPGSWRWGASLPACYLPATAIYPSAAAVARTGAQTPPLQYPSPPQQHGNDSQKQTQPITLHPWTYDEPAEAADAAGVRRLEQQRMHR